VSARAKRLAPDASRLAQAALMLRLFLLILLLLALLLAGIFRVTRLSVRLLLIGHDCSWVVTGDCIRDAARTVPRKADVVRNEE
jgi:hypothetical protein